MMLDKLQTLLERYAPDTQSIVDKLTALESADNQKLNVVVYGSYNSGKSSLLNSIIGALNYEYFPTNDVPETRKNKVFEQDNVCFMDTPGLDVNGCDTKQANSGAAQGDVLIFVHKLTSGSIQQHDMDAIKRIFESHTNPESILFVLTAGEIASSSQAVIEEITHQVHLELGYAAELFVVSNSVFKKGVLEEKPKLVEFSGMVKLQTKLKQMVDDTSKSYSESRKKKCRSLLDTCLKIVQESKREQQALLEQEKNKDAEFKRKFVVSVQKTKNNVTKRMKEIESI